MNTKLAELVFGGRISQEGALWRVTDAQVTETWPKMGSDEPLLIETRITSSNVIDCD